MVALSAVHDYVSGTCSAGVVSSAADVLGMRGVGKVCMCFARGGVQDEWIRGLGLGFTNPVGKGGV